MVAIATAIQISDEARKEPQKSKTHKREALEDVIERLVAVDYGAGGFDVNETGGIKDRRVKFISNFSDLTHN